MSIIDLEQRKKEKNKWKLSSIVKLMQIDPRGAFEFIKTIAGGSGVHCAKATEREVAAFNLGILQGMAALQVNSKIYPNTYARMMREIQELITEDPQTSSWLDFDYEGFNEQKCSSPPGGQGA